MYNFHDGCRSRKGKNGAKSTPVQRKVYKNKSESSEKRHTIVGGHGSDERKSSHSIFRQGSGEAKRRGMEFTHEEETGRRIHLTERRIRVFLRKLSI